MKTNFLYLEVLWMRWGLLERWYCCSVPWYGDMEDATDNSSLKLNVMYSNSQEHDKFSNLLSGHEKFIVTWRNVLSVCKYVSLYTWMEHTSGLQRVNFFCYSLMTEDKYLTSTLSQYTCFYNGRRHWRPDYTLHLSMTEILKTYQKAIFQLPESLQASLCLNCPKDVVKKEAWSWYIPAWRKYSQQKCHLYFLFFCLKVHKNRGTSGISWGKWDSFIARRKTQVYTSPEKLKHMLNFHFLMLKFPLLRGRLINSHRLQLYKCCIPTVLYCQEIKWM